MGRELKTGRVLWDEVEKLSREENGVGEDWSLTGVNLLGSTKADIARCSYELFNRKEGGFLTGIVSFDPFIKG
ncbi:hypothetical protein [Paenibacillus sp. UASWS1643]|uniref:hypothetical protein n=1 Tax=Paenibacillus sp. UASWS1643 TaxID=2580422 RepID=UPI001238AD1B|nr:hypothetical protein [Paenibacillus sp. UASWS1643]KAA8750045.1 hypothetical protein FE296_15720 [Paenibacillus sp. UASWS1643]